MKFITFAILFFLILFSAFAESKPLDSIRVETIGGKKFIIHKIEKGQGLYAIARRYNIDVQKIFDANSGKQNKIKTGDLVKVPLLTADSLVSEEIKIEKKPTEMNIQTSLPAKSKKVKPVADSIAKKSETVSVDEAHANADSKESEKVKIHVVAQGETIAKIAQKYKITSQLIYKWNGLKSNKLEVGQNLIVDGSIVIKPFEKWNTPNSVSSKLSPNLNILSAADIIEETGYAQVGNAKNILHKNAPVGTLILLTNLENGKQCYVKVTGNVNVKDKDQILVVDQTVMQKLNAISDTIRVKIQYSIP